MRAHNFCAGPAALPAAVLERAQAELLNWQGAGASVMELSHRSPEFVGIAERAEASLRRLLGIGEDYAVLFQQGGASQSDKPVASYAELHRRLEWINVVNERTLNGTYSKQELLAMLRRHSIHLSASRKKDELAIELMRLMRERFLSGEEVHVNAYAPAL